MGSLTGGEGQVRTMLAVAAASAPPVFVHNPPPVPKAPPPPPAEEGAAALGADYLQAAQESFQVYDSFMQSLAQGWGSKVPSSTESDGAGGSPSLPPSPPWIQQVQGAGGGQTWIKTEDGQAPLLAVGPSVSPTNNQQAQALASKPPAVDTARPTHALPLPLPPGPPSRQPASPSSQQPMLLKSPGPPDLVPTPLRVRSHRSSLPSFAVGASSSGSSESGSASARHTQHYEEMARVQTWLGNPMNAHPTVRPPSRPLVVLPVCPTEWPTD
jgi:hypothetical protein